MNEGIGYPAELGTQVRANSTRDPVRRGGGEPRIQLNGEAQVILESCLASTRLLNAQNPGDLGCYGAARAIISLHAVQGRVRPKWA